MNFTREPIIETIISPKDGYKLLVRNSRAVGSSDEYYVDAVEVVSFGRAFFFRSLERPKAFLVPASDYEILEVKETRVALKNVSHERNIKIGGGREASFRQQREVPAEKESEISVEEEQPQVTAEESILDNAIGQRMEKRRDRRRRRHRRSAEEAQEWSERRQQQGSSEPQETDEAENAPQQQNTDDEVKSSIAMFSSLIPPPSTLISDTIGRYKDKEFYEGEREEPKKEDDTEHKAKDKDDDDQNDGTGTDSTPLNRVTSEAKETSTLSTFFSPIQGGNGFFF